MKRTPKKRAASVPRLRILGCGEAFDTGLGNNSCLLYDPAHEIPTVLFDCGYQIPERLWELTHLYRELDAVVFTHLHLDHAFGLAPLLVRYLEEGRTQPLGVFGPKGTASFCAKLLDLGAPGLRRKLPFKVEFCELKDKDSKAWAGLTLRTARSIHSVLNLAVRVDGPGFSFAVSGDGAPTPGTFALYDGVQVLLHEVYTVEKEIPTHANLENLVKWVSGSAAERVGITHVCRTEKADMKQAYQALRRLDPRWFLLKPGMEISFE